MVALGTQPLYCTPREPRIRVHTHMHAGHFPKSALQHATTDGADV